MDNVAFSCLLPMANNVAVSDCRKIDCVAVDCGRQGRSQSGAGRQCPHHESLLPPPQANFRNLANLEEALEKMQLANGIFI